MKKRLLSLLTLAVVVALTTAPVALADHCYRCSVAGKCRPAPGAGGAAYCDDFTTPGVCVLSGTCSGPHPFTEEEVPLAADFVVASVERMDERMNEPQPVAATGTRVASLETSQPAQR